MKYLHAIAQTPNGAMVSVHRLHRATLEKDRVLITLNHYADANQDLPTWQDEYPMPIEAFQVGQYPDCVWNWISAPGGLFPDGQVIDGDSDLETARKEKLHQIARLRDGYLEGGFTVEGTGTFQTDPRSIENLRGVALRASFLGVASDVLIKFRLADNSEVMLDVQSILDIAGLIEKFRSDVYERSWALKQLVHNAQSLEELQQIEVGAGWP